MNEEMATGIEAVLRRPSIKRLCDSVEIDRIAPSADKELRHSFGNFVTDVLNVAIESMLQNKNKQLTTMDIYNGLNTDAYKHVQDYAMSHAYSAAPCRLGIKKGACNGRKEANHVGHMIEHGICLRGCTDTHGIFETAVINGITLPSRAIVHHFLPFSSFKPFVKVIAYGIYNHHRSEKKQVVRKLRITLLALEMLYVATQYRLQVLLRRGKSYFRIAKRRTLVAIDLLRASQVCDEENPDLQHIAFSDEPEYEPYQPPKNQYSNVNIYKKVEDGRYTVMKYKKPKKQPGKQVPGSNWPPIRPWRNPRVQKFGNWYVPLIAYLLHQGSEEIRQPLSTIKYNSIWGGAGGIAEKAFRLIDSKDDSETAITEFYAHYEKMVDGLSQLQRTNFNKFLTGNETFLNNSTQKALLNNISDIIDKYRDNALIHMKQ
jgi:histone H3/H4